jgi:hypothetical protein
MTRIPEPWEFADAHYARLDEERRAIMEESVCGDCVQYQPVPDKWVNTPCGYCNSCGEFVEYGDSVIEYECDAFKRWR